ncbi:MAG: hypothetical protein LBQ22_11170 [Bacteroidales bacterium]|jgi:hypothetical protein|nr:hypothetical protein [Bacteroidales bacterium]
MANPKKCPNSGNCIILGNNNLAGDMDMKEFYINQYCDNDTLNGFIQCKRFNTKNELGFCPDFVLPDSGMTIDEIISKLEE